MIYYVEREGTIDRHHEGCLSLGCAGKFIAFIELLFYAFIFFTVKSYLSSKWKTLFSSTYMCLHPLARANKMEIFYIFFLHFIAQQLLILMIVLALLSIMALFLFIGACVYDRVYVMPWIWTKYSLVFIQIMRFIGIIIQLSSSVKSSAGASPIFELLLLGELTLRVAT